MSDIDPRTEALADLGYRLINLVVASHRLGHKTLKMTAHYIHPGDADALLVHAVARGETDGARGALAEWMSAHPGLAAVFPEYVDPSLDALDAKQVAS